MFTYHLGALAGFAEKAATSGRGFAITLRHGSASELSSARERLEARPQLLESGPLSVVWAVLDKVVDDYEPVAARLTSDIEDVEVQVFSVPHDPTERIYFLKREVIEFYRAVHPLLAPLADLQRADYPGATTEIVNYFRDVKDHVERVHDEITAERELLTSALEANLAVLSVRQNETTKRLTTIATIFLPLSFITGFFGMNFGYMVPPKRLRLGSPACRSDHHPKRNAEDASGCRECSRCSFSGRSRGRWAG